MEPLLPLEGPDLELACHADGVAHALEERPVAVQRQLELVLVLQLQAVDRDDLLVIPDVAHRNRG